MTDSALQAKWKKFADAIGGSVTQTDRSYFNPDHIYHIKTDKEEVILSWADEPAMGRGANVNLQTVFRFNLKSKATPYLKVQPKDFLTSTFTVWNTNRRKSGDTELDRTYLFFANEVVPFSMVVYQLQQFHPQNKYRNFFIDTELESDTCTLLIQVNELITQEQDLYFFFEFGKRLVEGIDRGV